MKIHVKKYSQSEILPPETKQSRGKLLPHSDLWGSVSRGSINQQTTEKGLFLGTWNVRSLYRAGSLTAAARELARYKLDRVGVQEVRWDKGGRVRVIGTHYPVLCGW
jgi:hypothetical protein